ncbi:DUF5724 domain-containing protein [Microbacterium sp. OVT16B]|uniref:DUF5724 domain-containing protein n=1 Tax=Microbacterium sp. OVT16B TaxID=2862682 RepID=UPI001CC15ED8|nr:DUF5724 domain-containing protein [Microbacterium sp. OVT16B]
MLTAEQATEELSRFCSCDKEGVPRPVDVHGWGAPRLARRIADHLNVSSGAHDPEAAEAVRATARVLADEVDALDDRARTKALKALCPSVGAELSSWWVWSRSRPYVQGSWSSAPYRSTDLRFTLPSRWERLVSLIRHVTHYPQPIEWHATWLLHLPEHPRLGDFVASAVDAGNAAVRRILVEGISGSHAVAGPSAHAYVALLAADDAGAWDLVVGQLLDAGRAEGLRQTILDALDVAHPGAIERVLGTVADEGLIRFSSSIRALSRWVDEELTVRDAVRADAAVATIVRFLRTPPTSDDLRAGSRIEAYLGLWTLAVRDIGVAIGAAAELMDDDDAGLRLAASRMLVRLGHPSIVDALARGLEDDDPAVFAVALAAWPAHHAAAHRECTLTAAAARGLRERSGRLTSPLAVDIGIMAPRMVTLKKTDIIDVVAVYSDTDEIDIATASPDVRRGAAARYAKNLEGHRADLFRLLLDPSSQVRSVAHRGFAVESITDDEARELERALTRKADDIRKCALRLLQLQGQEGVIASVERLRAGTPDQRRAAEDLAQMAGLGRKTDSVAPQDSAGAFSDRPAALRFGVEERTPAVRPQAPSRSRWDGYHPGARRIWLSFEAWMDEHSDVEVQSNHGVQLLANVQGHELRTGDDGTMPLAELVDPWWERVRGDLIDGGVELALLSILNADQDAMGLRILGDIGRDRGDAQGSLRVALIDHLARRERRATWADPMIDLLALLAAELPTGRFLGPRNVRFGEDRRRIGSDPREGGMFGRVSGYLDPTSLDDQRLRRLWGILRFVDEPEGAVDQWDGPKVEWSDPWYRNEVDVSVDQPFRFRPPLEVVRTAFERGIATRADLVDWAFVRPLRQSELRGLETNPLARLSGITGAAAATQSVVDDVQRAVVELELPRGDQMTKYSRMAMSLQRVTGAETLVATVKALGRRPIPRRHLYAEDREEVFAHLIRVHHPASDETAESVAKAFATAKIPESRVIETAVYSPQWAEVFEEHLGWPGFASAVWWLHAHTPVDTHEINRDIRAYRGREIARRTAVPSDDRERGCADAEWFRRFHAELGDDHLDRVLKAAKYASVAGEHKQAELFANVLRGRVGEEELLARMHEKRHQDAVRAYGLLPLADEPEVLLQRYEVLRAFVSTGKTNGAQRRATETAAVHTALENLARSAGYRDPLRLTWAMEARTATDLLHGPVAATDGDLTVSLSIDAQGMPTIAVDRAGKPLASVPAASRKVERIEALRNRAAELKKQAQRMRSSLEAACVLGDVFEAGEIALLTSHPQLSRMLADLVLVDGEGRVGFLSGAGDELVRADGTAFEPVGGLRIAHPLDLLASGDWPDLQHEVMTRGRPQPFKQVFRELYVPTENEKGEGGVSSRRYAGHQIDARRASGLFTARGWLRDYGIGYERTFHNEKIHVFCNVDDGWDTAAGAEDATVSDVRFGPAGSHRAIPLDDVPPRVYSETMRDLDLVVSVAHSSGVDPQSSESTIEARRRIVEETCLLLGLENIEVSGHHVRVKGALGVYSVHLGSGIVHRIPGNTLFIIPVGGQHRGRVFLPFVDDDPRTAEVVSKVVMLASDDKIKDPTIVSQLVR